jgi:SAM-dependent methyltransferase
MENVDFFEINKQSWNNRTDAHLKSEFYDVQGFLNGNTSLKSIELNLLGNIEGKSILHLQCHFGQDSIALAQLGANVVGIDLSNKSIDAAIDLNKKVGTNVHFICCNIYDLPNYLNQKFDIVYTSYGTIGWLPNLDKWAEIIAHFLKPKGKFVFVEFHPVVWMFDDNFENVAYNYFNTGEIIETETGTYADKNAAITQQYVMWNHGFGEVVNSLIKHNLVIDSLDEFDYSPYNCFSNTEEVTKGKYRIKHLNNNIPMVYSITATLK